MFCKQDWAYHKTHDRGDVPCSGGSFPLNNWPSFSLPSVQPILVQGFSPSGTIDYFDGCLLAVFVGPEDSGSCGTPAGAVFALRFYPGTL